MATSRRFTMAAAALAVAGMFSAPALAQQADDSSPSLGDALLGGIKESRVVRKLPEGPFGERGSLQRTMFLDVVGSKKNLEIAFVLDGTSSMGQDIKAAVKSMSAFVDQLRDVKKSRDANITFALVVYRDTASPSGGVRVLVDRFTANAPNFKSVLETVQPEDGAPYFQEQVDVGLHTALTKLPWSDANDKEYTRWIVLCGDARPYHESGKDQRFRKYSTNDLISKAQQKKVQVYTIICRSGFTNNNKENAALLETARREHPAFLEFADKLASKTDGAVLDLWNKQLVNELAAAAKGEIRTYQRLKPITPDDIAQAHWKDTAGAPVRVAVLPHMKLDEMNTDPDRPEVQLATELRLLLNKAPQMQVRDAGAVADAIRITQRAGLADDRILAELAKKLRVDFILWGEYAASSDRGERLDTRLYRVTKDGTVSVIARADGSADMPDDRRPTPLTVHTLGTLLERTAGVLEKSNGIDKAWHTTFAAYAARRAPAETGDGLSNDSRAKRQILAGVERLEQSLSVTRQDASSVEAANKIAEAVACFEQALAFEPDNVFTQLQLANAAYSLSKHRDHEANAKKAFDALTAAYENRDKAGNEAIEQEIMADYAMLMQKDYRKAVEIYEAIAANPEFRESRFALRARWTLAGMYLGDWGVNEYEATLANDKLPEFGVVNVDKAREHIIAIMANWDGTEMADFYKSHLGGTTTAAAPADTQEALQTPPSQWQKQYVELPVGQMQLVTF
jgi:tetratricopeptide (TPR) repeat protein